MQRSTIVGILLLWLAEPTLSPITAQTQEVIDTDARMEGLLDSPKPEARSEAVNWFLHSSNDPSSNVDRRARIAAKLQRLATQETNREARVAALLAVHKIHEADIAAYQAEILAAASEGDRNAAELLLAGEDLPIAEILGAVKPSPSKDYLAHSFFLVLRYCPLYRLSHQLNHKNAEVRQTVAEALTDRLTENRYTEQALLRMLKDTDATVRRTALFGAIEHGCQWRSATKIPQS